MTQPRNIVLLSDGTGNSRGKAHQTNVWRTYEALDLTDPSQPQQPRQFAYYDDGVGTSSFAPLAMLGGALGYGLARNVRDLYEFLCRTYRDGDRIYAFGFSRGAFTIRVLLGLICTQGLVPYRGNEAELRRLSTAAFRAYRRERYKLWFNWIAVPRWLRDATVDLWARLRGHTRYEAIAQQRMVDVHFVGVWDTVAAYGMPIDELATFINHVVWPLDMPGLNLNAKVERAVHALALDDERYTFHPKLWDPDPGRIDQVWFAGMHSDVGGGYPDKGLAHVSLHWMLTEASKAGLRLLSAVRLQQQALADENGPMNDSRHGLAGYYRYKPRELRPGSVIHESVLRRIQVGQDAYAPIVLPKDFRVLGFDGQIRPGVEVLGGADMDRYEAARQRALNRVWLRRGVYFATVAATLSLLMLPISRSDDGTACTTAWCWISPAIGALTVLLPSMMEGWATWYAANPGSFLSVGGLCAVGLLLGSLLQRAVFDAMRRAWYAIPAVRPTTLGAGTPSSRAPSALGTAVIGLRNSATYRATIVALRRFVLPAVSGVLLVALVAMLANSLWFAVRASNGNVCAKTEGAVAVGVVPVTRTFSSSAACSATGLELRAGGTYRVVLTIDEAEPWRDDDLPADWRGVQQQAWYHPLAWLLKRELSQPIFAPMARIGDQGADVYPLRAEPSQPKAASRTVLEARIVARTDGELFLYVNDVVGAPWDPLSSYADNHGRATVSIRQVAARAE